MEPPPSRQKERRARKRKKNGMPKQSGTKKFLKNTMASPNAQEKKARGRPKRVLVSKEVEEQNAEQTIHSVPASDDSAITEILSLSAIEDHDIDTTNNVPVLVSAVHHQLAEEDRRLAFDLLPQLFEGKTLGQAAKKINVPLSRIQPLKNNTAFRRLVSIASDSRKDILEAELYDRIFNGDNDNLLLKALEQLDPSYRSGFTQPPLNAVKIDIRLDGETMKIVAVDNERRD